MKLSICIPTYNRRDKVVNQLSRLLPQLLKFPPTEVEIIVSDNCSNDGTSIKLKEHEYANKFELITQVENLGLVGNLYYLFEHARGEYVWFLSDDDIVEFDAIDNLMASIRNSNKDFYLINFRLDNQSSNSYWIQTDNILSLFNSDTWGGFGLLSAQVLRKDAFREFYFSTRESFNLCQPVAVSLFGLFYLRGEILFNQVYLTHHVGDYSWASKEIEVNSIYLFDSICLLKQYGKELVFKRLLTHAITSSFMANASIRYILKTKDKKYISALKTEGVYFKMWRTAILSYISKKIIHVKTSK